MREIDFIKVCQPSGEVICEIATSGLPHSLVLESQGLLSSFVGKDRIVGFNVDALKKKCKGKILIGVGRKRGFCLNKLLAEAILDAEKTTNNRKEFVVLIETSRAINVQKAEDKMQSAADYLAQIIGKNTCLCAARYGNLCLPYTVWIFSLTQIMSLHRAHKDS